MTEDSLSSVSSRDLKTHFGFFLAQTSYPAIPAQAWPFPVVRIFCENVFYICMVVPLLGLLSHSSTFFYATPPLQLSEGREMARTPNSVPAFNFSFLLAIFLSWLHTFLDRNLLHVFFTDDTERSMRNGKS